MHSFLRHGVAINVKKPQHTIMLTVTRTKNSKKASAAKTDEKNSCHIKVLPVEHDSINDNAFLVFNPR